MNYPEIKEAIKRVMEARADITNCVNFSKEDLENADWLYYQCKRYCEEYKKNSERLVTK